MRKEALVLMLLLLLFQTVVAQTLELGDLYSVEYLWEEVFGLPAEWMIPRNFIFNFMVPFLALFAVCLGMIRAIGMFRRSPNIEVILAFAMAFMTLPSKFFVWFVSFTLGLAGMYSYILFLIMFFLGGGIYTYTFYLRKLTSAEVAKSYLEATKRLYDRFEEVDIKLKEVESKLAQPFLPDATREKLLKEAIELRAEREKLLAELRKIKEAQEIA